MASPSKMKREKKKERKVKRGNRNMEQNLRASLKRIETGSTDSRQKETTAVKEISTIVSGCIKEDPFKRPYTLLPPSPHPTPAYSSWSTYDILCGSGRVLPGEWKLVFVSRCLDDIVQLVFRLWKPPHNHPPPLSPMPPSQPTNETNLPTPSSAEPYASQWRLFFFFFSLSFFFSHWMLIYSGFWLAVYLSNWPFIRLNC